MNAKTIHTLIISAGIKCSPATGSVTGDGSTLDLILGLCIHILEALGVHELHDLFHLIASN